MNLLTLFCAYHPDFMEKLSSFSEINRDRLLKKLKSADNKTTFRSTISEIRFGEFFKKLDFEIEYDKRIDNKTPDWTLNNTTLPIICEVYRLGKSSKDQKRSDFENSLKEKLAKIPSNLLIKITIDDEYDNFDKLQIDLLKSKVELWIEKQPIINEELNLDYEIKFKVMAVSNSNQFLSCINSGIIDYKPGKVKQIENEYPNEVTKKRCRSITI